MKEECARGVIFDIVLSFVLVFLGWLVGFASVVLISVGV